MVWCSCFLSEEEKSAIERDKEINLLLQKHKRRFRPEQRLLLLGTGESGKSTFIKQMRIIHGTGYTEEDRKSYTKVVYQNIFTSIQTMIKAMETLQIPYDQPENAQNAQFLLGVETYKLSTMEAHHAEMIQSLWRDTGIKICYKRRSEYHLLDSAFYFFSNLGRIAAEDYVPTAQDILQIHEPTTCIEEYYFTLPSSVQFRIIDVSGQKSEHRKWIHCFEGVAKVIYMASLSEYDQCLEENSSKNRMRESLDLFRKFLELPFFHHTSIILLLNKTDILEEKIVTSDLASYFPSFPGPQRDVNAAKKFILQMYMDIFQHILATDSSSFKATRVLYHHFTCTTDTQNICKVFEEIRDRILIFRCTFGADLI